MVRITADLIRKRSEHNEGVISTLEEISLHMQNLEKIEHLDRWCRDLKILLLQNNIIPKIENLSRLKKLEYLNLSLNIIERVENLEGCESLNKLDLTLNFIGELTSIESLAQNYNLTELSLMGNPCSDFEGYREFVIVTLPQLQLLDTKPVERSERTLAIQKMPQGLRDSIIQQQNKYQEFREIQKLNAPKSLTERLAENEEDIPEDERLRDMWSEKGENSPELRIFLSELSVRQEELKNEKPKEKPKPPRVLFNKDGNPLNVNEPKLKFSISEEDNSVVLKLHLNRCLDTRDIDTDVHPKHVKVVIQGLVFQLRLLHEVKPDLSKAERSLSTGTLVITMPMVEEFIFQKEMPDDAKPKAKVHLGPSMRQLLEIGPKDRDNMDFSRIVKYEEDVDEFIDNPEVPPLEEQD